MISMNFNYTCIQEKYSIYDYYRPPFTSHQIPSYVQARTTYYNA